MKNMSQAKPANVATEEEEPDWFTLTTLRQSEPMSTILNMDSDDDECDPLPDLCSDTSLVIDSDEEIDRKPLPLFPFEQPVA